MELYTLADGLILFLGFVLFVTLHEFAHAWTACRCGDITPRLQGRLTLDPLAHIDWLGTVLLPLIMVALGAMTGRFSLFGWGRPVMVNLDNFRHRRRDDILVSAAGPAMNFLIAVLLILLAKGFDLAGQEPVTQMIFKLARFSMFLCFFNLLPVPPLDGGHILRNLIGISDEAYAAISQYSFILFIVLMHIPEVGAFVSL